MYLLLLEGIIVDLLLPVSPLLDQEIADDHGDYEDVADHSVHDHQFI